MISSTSAQSAAETSEMAEPVRQDDELKPAPRMSAPRSNETTPGVRSGEDARSGVAGDNSAGRGNRTIQVAGESAPPKRHRMREAARGAVEESLLPRVEKLRQASNVVLDEASYDPSLRFVLIAIALFLVFLVLLLASKVLG